MIYCGYQGCGKTTYCKNNPDTAVDLDSSNFPKVENWHKAYCEKAIEISRSGKNVFISAHYDVIIYLLEGEDEFEILAPAENKEAWEHRLSFRYHQNPTLPNLKALNDFRENFEEDMAYYKQLESSGLVVHWIHAKVKTNIDEFIK